MNTLQDFKKAYDSIELKSPEDVLYMSEDERLTYLRLLRSKQNFNETNQILNFFPDDWFMEVSEIMEDEPVTGVISGNRCGKSYSSTWLMACHLTGIYPNGYYHNPKLGKDEYKTYNGYKFKEGIDSWVLTSTAEQYVQSGGLQEYLFGKIDNPGTGWIPKDRIIKLVSGIGTKGLIKKAFIKHINEDTGEESVSTIEFKSYSQGQSMMMGASISFALIDEEAPMDVFTQVITRTATPKTGKGTGRVLVSMTPEKGYTELVNAFFEGHYIKGLVRGTVDKVTFITPDDIEDMKKRYPEYQWDMRLNGIPTAGQGVIYPFKKEDIICSSLTTYLKPHFQMIAAVDLGINDPTSISIIAKDPDTQKVYVVEEFYEKGVFIPEVASWLKKRLPNIPLVLPHDGFNKTQNAGGATSYSLFEKEGLNLVFERFSNPPEPNGKKNNHIEPGLSFIREGFRTGDIKIFDNCDNHLTEITTYAYGSNGKPLPIQKDHAMDSMRYAIMMIDRYGEELHRCKSNNYFNSFDTSETTINFN